MINRVVSGERFVGLLSFKLLSFFLLLFLFSLSLLHLNVIKPVSAQMVIDSFSAKGVINTEILGKINFDRDIDKNTYNLDSSISNNDTNESKTSFNNIGDESGSNNDSVIIDKKKRSLISISNFFKNYSRQYLAPINESNSKNEINNLISDNDVNRSNELPTSQPIDDVISERFVLNGEWILIVNKGDPENFQVIFTLLRDGKIVNAFGIYNLKDTGYIQLNNEGTKIISGKVDFQSAGLRNETIKDVDATVSLIGLKMIKITLDKSKTFEYFKGKPLVGTTKLFLDGIGNMLLGPSPQQPGLVPQNSDYRKMVMS